MNEGKSPYQAKAEHERMLVIKRKIKVLVLFLSGVLIKVRMAYTHPMIPRLRPAL
jgi:hypothetical protein